MTIIGRAIEGLATRAGVDEIANDLPHLRLQAVENLAADAGHGSAAQLGVSGRIEVVNARRSVALGALVLDLGSLAVAIGRGVA
jgi:hypothetical protein